MTSPRRAELARRADAARAAAAGSAEDPWIAETVLKNVQRLDTLEQGLILAFEAGGADVPEILHPSPARPDLKLLRGGAA